jgi:hypothetical protein
MATLKRWILTKDGCLFGRIHNDIRYDSITTEFQDNHRIITSPVKVMADDESYAITQSGTKYILGTRLKPGEKP